MLPKNVPAIAQKTIKSEKTKILTTEPSGVAALQRVATEKGYSLVAITDTNCIFVQNIDMPKFSDYDTDRDHMRVDRYTSYIICDYSER